MASPIFLLLSGLIGLVIGLIAGRYIDPVRKGQWQNSSDLKQKKNELETLRSQVNEHFSQTARNIKTLQAQLISDASQITGLDLDISEDLQSTSNLTRLVGESTEPPLDYAPKAGGSVGTLSEEYGLKDEAYEADKKSA